MTVQCQDMNFCLLLFVLYVDSVHHTFFLSLLFSLLLNAAIAGNEEALKAVAESLFILILSGWQSTQRNHLPLELIVHQVSWWLHYPLRPPPRFPCCRHWPQPILRIVAMFGKQNLSGWSLSTYSLLYENFKLVLFFSSLTRTHSQKPSLWITCTFF